jgi:hypothetical protein
MAADPELGRQTGRYFARGRARRLGRRVSNPQTSAAWWEQSRSWLEPDERKALDAILQR